MHQNNITHKDIIPENILIFEGPILKITGFASAKSHNDNTMFVSKQKFTKLTYYSAPEVQMQEIRSNISPFSQDVYSLGMIACRIMAKEIPK